MLEEVYESLISLVRHTYTTISGSAYDLKL